MKRNRAGCETDILSSIKGCLGLFGTIKVWRNNTRVVRLGGRPVSFGLCPGSSDLIGLTSKGRFVALEVKKPGEKATEAQESFMDDVRRMGGFACVVTSTTEAIAAMQRALKGESE